ncbi:MAG TPA: hypothetical protein VJL87_02925 [Bdellovibrionota bacterium]|nr:hypothetical protein [Bdellovibrionota bacterium]
MNRLGFLLFLLVSFCFTGCGVKGPPLPPLQHPKASPLETIKKLEEKQEQTKKKTQKKNKDVGQDAPL